MTPATVRLLRSFWPALALAAALFASPALARQVGEPEVCPIAPPGPCLRTPWPQIEANGRRIRIVAPVRLDRREAAPLAVTLQALAASRVTWDGRLLGANGRPGDTRAEEIPGRRAAVFVIPEALAGPGLHRLEIDLSSHALPIRVGGSLLGLDVGPYRDPLDRALRAYLPAMMAAGGLVIAGLYFVALVLFGRAAGYTLFLSAAVLAAAGQLAVECARAFANYPYPEHAWRLALLLAFAAAFSLSLAGYAARRFAPSWTAHLLAGAAALAAVGVWLGPYFDHKVASVLLAGAAAATVAAAAGLHRRQAGSGFTLAAMALILVAAGAGVGAFLDRFFYIALVAAALLLILEHAVELRRLRAARDEAVGRATRLELELLKRQVSPHYILNTLNALLEWIESSPRTAARMIEALAQEFRLLSRFSSRRLIPLSQEVELCRNYLDLMSLRSDLRLDLQVTCAEPDLLIPPAVIHTLVENAFSHARYHDGAVFHLRQQSAAGRATLTLDTPAPAMAVERESGGAGHAYVRARLTESFGAAWTFTAGPREDGGWRSELTFAC